MNLVLLTPLLSRAAAFGVLVLLDFLTGIAKALATHTFAWQKLADVLKNNALYFVGWLAVDFSTLVATQLGYSDLLNGVAGLGALALFAATMTRSILGNLSELVNTLTGGGAKG